MSLPYEGPDDYFDADTIGDIVGVSAGRIRQYVKDGMPRKRRGEYGLRACVRWAINTWRERALGQGLGTSLEEARRRKEVASAALKEAELRERTGDLIPADEVRDMLETIFIPFKRAIERIPTKLAGRLKGKTKVEIKEELEEELRTVLEDLSTTAIELRKAADSKARARKR